MPEARLPAPGRNDARRLFGVWWRRQTPARQDRFATLGPLFSVLLFLAAIVSAFWYLRNEEIERESDSVRRDTEITQQQIAVRLLDNQEQLIDLTRELVARDGGSEPFAEAIASFTRKRPEITRVAWVDAQHTLRLSHWAMLHRPSIEVPAGASAPASAPARSARAAAASRSAAPAAPAGPAALPPAPAEDPGLPRAAGQRAADRAFRIARDARTAVYSAAFTGALGQPVFQLQLPMVERGAFAGVLLVEYSVDSLLRHFVPGEVANRHRVTVIDENQQALASTVTLMPGAQRRAPITSDAPLTPALNGLLLRGQGYRTSVGLISSTLFWMVVALSVLTVWMLLGTWSHVRRRAQIQSALLQETQFRRAMENSMPTGMRAMDLEGRITYVNAAFSQMTGFRDSELVGRLPPFPYWPLDRVDENARLLQQELAGRSPVGGIEVKVSRKDGSTFDARMYVSPLIDPKGHQTGWMTSMTNITEAKRIRDQLSASHERFTTVLEGLDASVSVLSVVQGELLFANRSYRLWFGGDARGHTQLAGSLAPEDWAPQADDDVDNLSGLPTQELTEAGTAPREVHVESLGKWFDVRSRYLQWTDGRLAQMLIATDITARLRAEEQAAAQAEKAQVTSRLVTMGEMASSVAHELNQPLTAITNYCNGIVSRVRSNSIDKDDLIAALAKTARQAERAGQIIHRIRAFVRRSEPQRQPSDARQIVDDAVDLAGIELRRRNVAIHTYVAQRLPTLSVDPILIEQVVLNLLKNAAEAIDAAKLPSARRHIELRVVPRHSAEEGDVIEFSVTDMGPGLKDEVIARLYEAFFSTKAEGLGIGLSLCRTIVESHRGRMRAQNLYNGAVVTGCRFAFTLPVEPTARAEPAPARSDPAHAAAPPTETAAGLLIEARREPVSTTSPGDTAPAAPAAATTES
jgi:PAS domain S-box-containing protein